MLSIYSAALPILLFLSNHHHVQGNDSFSEIAANHRAADKAYNTMLREYLDEDENCPPGPPEGWPHTEPFSYTPEAQLEYTNMVDNDMQTQYQQLNQLVYGAGGGIHQTEIARPESSTTGYYTGVTHIQHVNNENLVTFFFSAGRKDGGSNTYSTINKSDENPFDGVQELYIDEEDIQPWTWVSTETIVDEGEVYHYVLFSGGNSGPEISPSKLYIYQEDSHGDLILPPTVAWEEDVSILPGPARFCLVEDLGDIYGEDDNLVSRAGTPDLIVTGIGGVFIYSKQQQEDWKLVRSIIIQPNCDLFYLSDQTCVDDLTAAYLGVQKLDGHLIIGGRTRARNAGAGLTEGFPSISYDYRNDKIVQLFSDGGQTVSVALLDGKTKVLLGTGSETGLSGEPNLSYDVTFDEPEEHRHRYLNETYVNGTSYVRGTTKTTKTTQRSRNSPTSTPSKAPSKAPSEDLLLDLTLSDTQLAFGMPTEYTPFEEVDFVPVSSEEYFIIPSPGNTKTRQVLPFKIDDDTPDLVLEVNSAQTCNIYYRPDEDMPASKVLPLPGSEGVDTFDEDGIFFFARAGDTLLIEDTLYVILAVFNGNNTVYSFSTDVF